MNDFKPLDNVGGWISGMVRNLDQWMKPTTLEKPTIPRPAPPPIPQPRPQRGPLSPLPDSQTAESQGFISPVSAQMSSPIPSPIPSPLPQSVPGGIDLAMQYYLSRLPNGMSQTDAFPILADSEFMQKITEADKLRQGLANFLLMQAFFESTGGRLTPNTFGVKPQGESRKFNTPSEALDYQLGPRVLGGGANPNMNILNNNTPLTLEDVKKLYSSYNPEGVYLDQLLEVLGGGGSR